jgi:hypothetical protein
MSTQLPEPDYARNMRIVGHCNQGGRPDGVQIMVHRGHAYIGPHVLAASSTCATQRHRAR